MKREYKLAARPLRTNMGPTVREILEYADGQRTVFLVVKDDPDAANVLEAIRRAYQDGWDDRATRTPRTPMPAGDRRSVITALGIYPGRNGWVTFRLKPAEATALSATTDPAAYLRSALAAHGVTTPASLTQHAAKAGKSRSQYARDILLNALNHQEGHQT